MENESGVNMVSGFPEIYEDSLFAQSDIDAEIC